MEALWEDFDYLEVFVFPLGALASATVAWVMVRLARAKSAYLGFLGPSAHRSIPLTSYSVPSSWIISGSPSFNSNVFSTAHDQSASSGLWECIGPAQFAWHYGTDEVIYILEGSAAIAYLGRKFILRPGDRMQFGAGTIANWTVPERVKKSYTVYEPGRLIRAARRIVRLLKRA